MIISYYLISEMENFKKKNYPFIVEHDPLIVDLPIKNGGAFP